MKYYFQKISKKHHFVADCKKSPPWARRGKVNKTGVEHENGAATPKQPESSNKALLQHNKHKPNWAGATTQYEFYRGGASKNK